MRPSSRRGARAISAYASSTSRIGQAAATQTTGHSADSTVDSFGQLRSSGCLNAEAQRSDWIT